MFSLKYCRELRSQRDARKTTLMLLGRKNDQKTWWCGTILKVWPSHLMLIYLVYEGYISDWGKISPISIILKPLQAVTSKPSFFVVEMLLWILCVLLSNSGDYGLPRDRDTLHAHHRPAHHSLKVKYVCSLFHYLR